MTAEIAILNLSAVALAADSAVTSSGSGTQKIFPSANKLFALSELAPVGILIFGEAHFREIPWETLIKEYRRSRSTKTFGTLAEYSSDFRHFLTQDISNYIDVIDSDRSDYFSGVAIAGFGDKELLPAISEVHIFSDNGKVIIDEVHSLKVDPIDKYAHIKPLAQRDAVDQFMQGIASAHQVFIEELLKNLLNKNAEHMVELVASVLGYTPKDINTRLKEINEGTSDLMLEEITNFTGEVFIHPTMDIVAMLPKEQLAEMAEALVNLTALRRRVSPQEETVGGPIDVAIITKGDGMVWTKRKHYFPPELNRAYFIRRRTHTGG